LCGLNFLDLWLEFLSHMPLLQQKINPKKHPWICSDSLTFGYTFWPSWLVSLACGFCPWFVGLPPWLDGLSSWLFG
jgi:hypothetical protein